MKTIYLYVHKIQFPQISEALVLVIVYIKVSCQQNGNYITAVICVVTLGTCRNSRNGNSFHLSSNKLFLYIYKQKHM